MQRPIGFLPPLTGRKMSEDTVDEIKTGLAAAFDPATKTPGPHLSFLLGAMRKDPEKADGIREAATALASEYLDYRNGDTSAEKVDEAMRAFKPLLPLGSGELAGDILLFMNGVIVSAPQIITDTQLHRPFTERNPPGGAKGPGDRGVS